VALSLAGLTDAEVWTLAVEEHLPRFAATVDETRDEKAFADLNYAMIDMKDEGSPHAAMKLASCQKANSFYGARCSREQARRSFFCIDFPRREAEC